MTTRRQRSKWILHADGFLFFLEPRPASSSLLPSTSPAFKKSEGFPVSSKGRKNSRTQLGDSLIDNNLKQKNKTCKHFLWKIKHGLSSKAFSWLIQKDDKSFKGSPLISSRIRDELISNSVPLFLSFSLSRLISCRVWRNWIVGHEIVWLSVTAQRKTWKHINPNFLLIVVSVLLIRVQLI